MTFVKRVLSLLPQVVRLRGRTRFVSVWLKSKLFSMGLSDVDLPLLNATIFFASSLMLCLLVAFVVQQ
ncbi:MAG: hypothetical protein DI556_19260 [Rhodovulum sulfidophilum]|uniref:Uncharacterized protein n=1 Tax=Rhodovulum sulfidophilum TaxID=35806 RepID=A0A2W5MZQ9_RHOSU|nr:MAG: hypothetical protein DI556_19260 [Rhodovulum sulfidophilum]